MFYQNLRKFYLNLINTKDEANQILNTISSNVKKDKSILDVGCGYGRNLELLKGAGYTNITGVEKNSFILNITQSKGFECLDIEQIKKSTKKYDLILMSHVIEHINPENLLIFIDEYLDKLTAGGYLLIATPVLSEYFYDDFDHIKPYLPTGLMNIFGGNRAQVQYYSRNQLELVDLWFRKDFYKFNFYRSAYIKTSFTRLVLFMNLLSALLFRVSFGIFGKVDGWVGLFRKKTK